MKVTMKFYQTIASVMFCIIYTASIFGSEFESEDPTLFYVPKVIWKIIENFRGKDGVYKEVGHLEPYENFLVKAGEVHQESFLVSLYIQQQEMN